MNKIFKLGLVAGLIAASSSSFAVTADGNWSTVAHGSSQGAFDVEYSPLEQILINGFSTLNFGPGSADETLNENLCVWTNVASAYADGYLGFRVTVVRAGSNATSLDLVSTTPNSTSSAVKLDAKYGVKEPGSSTFSAENTLQLGTPIEVSPTLNFANFGANTSGPNSCESGTYTFQIAMTLSQQEKEKANVGEEYKATFNVTADLI